MFRYYTSIKQRVIAGVYLWASEQEINAEIQKRAQEKRGPIQPTQPVKRSRSGLKRAVIVKGVRYSSLTEAAKANNISVQAMAKRIKNQMPEHYYADNSFFL